MIRSAASKVMWVGRATVFLVGLAVILALVFGAAATALAGTGVGATFNLGKSNTVNRVSSMVGSHAGSMLVIDNNGTGSALDLRVGPSTATPDNNNVAPMRVNSQRMVTNLNADELDGLDSTSLAAPRGYARVSPTTPLLVPGKSKGINGILKSSTDSSMYCFDLDFNDPHAAVASPASFNNNATIGTSMPAPSGSGCPAEHTDAAAKTLAGNTSAPQSDVHFSIAFM